MTSVRTASLLKRRSVFAAALIAALLAPAGVGAAPLFQRDPDPVRIHVAQSAEAAQLALQLQQMQEQIRLLTGQVEGLQFQLTQMQTLIERMTEDNEFRFQQLEGGAAGKPQAATEPDSATPSAELPQDPAVAEVQPLGEPMDSLPALTDPAVGDSQDPMVGNGGLGQSGTLGTLDGEGVALGEGVPLDLSLDGGSAVSNGDANAQYQAGYDAIVRGDYAFAEDQFQQFIALYPDDPQAPDATNWLGEALIQRGAFDDAALVLAEGYQKYSQTERAPDLMLKLGVALVGAGEVDVACRTFFTLEKRFPNLAPAFVQRLGEEKAKAQCRV